MKNVRNLVAKIDIGFQGCGSIPFEVSQPGSEMVHSKHNKSDLEKSVCANVVNFTTGFVVELSFLKFEMDW